MRRRCSTYVDTGAGVDATDHTLSVYVAGATRNQRRTRQFFERVNKHPGMSLVFDWLSSVASTDVADDELTDAERCAYARTDLDEIRDADALVLLTETYGANRGSWVELGYALRLRDFRPTPFIIMAGGARLSIFAAPGMVDLEICCDSNEESDAIAFAELGKLVTPRCGRRVVDAPGHGCARERGHSGQHVATFRSANDGQR